MKNLELMQRCKDEACKEIYNYNYDYIFHTYPKESIHKIIDLAMEKYAELLQAENLKRIAFYKKKYEKLGYKVVIKTSLI